MEELVILHISDLHFGIENDKTEQTKYVRLRQRESLKSLIETIKSIVEITPDWKPNIIAISGDISWSGQPDEYKLYKKHFAVPLSEALNISQDHIITCPGNHDIIRNKVYGLSRHPKESIDPDVNDLNIAEISKQAKHFKGYVDELCNGDSSQLCKIVSYPEYPWVSFLSLNSAWDCRNDADEGRLRVGLPLFETLIDNVPDENYVITLFHHPHTEVDDYIETIDGNRNRVIKCKKRQWLHISERESVYPGGRSFTDYVEQKSTFILNGHIHKETEPQKLNKSIQLISGTLYSNDTPKYHCRLLKLSKKKDPCYRDLRRNLGDDGDWEVTQSKRFQFEHIAIIISRKQAQQEREREFGIRLMEAQKQFEQDNNLDEYKAAISEIARELSNEAIKQSSKEIEQKKVLFRKSDRSNPRRSAII